MEENWADPRFHVLDWVWYVISFVSAVVCVVNEYKFKIYLGERMMNTQFHSRAFVVGLDRPESDLCYGQRFCLRRQKILHIKLVRYYTHLLELVPFNKSPGFFLLPRLT
jgi:hypothetical protein